MKGFFSVGGCLLRQNYWVIVIINMSSLISEISEIKGKKITKTLGKFLAIFFGYF